VQIKAEEDAHRTACARFGAVVALGKGAWDRPSPCKEWTAGQIVEHVIELHESRFLKPLHVTRAVRTGNGVVERWRVTESALEPAFAKLAGPQKTAFVGDQKKRAALPLLTLEVLVHTWDLARALDVVVSLDTQLCEDALWYVTSRINAFRTSGRFGSENVAEDGASPESRLVALLGRDPHMAIGRRSMSRSLS
jgi:uncharacterized protein (TIGR03086 family)